MGSLTKKLKSISSKEKILKTPHQGVPSYSAKKVISSIASSTSPELVKEVEARIIPKTSFFSKEFEKEEKETLKWMGR